MDIDTKVTPSLHPHNVEAIDGYDSETAPAVVEALGAFRAAYDGLSDVHKAREAARKNPVLTDAARLLATADFAEQHQNTITRKFDKAHQTLTTAIDALKSPYPNRSESGPRDQSRTRSERTSGDLQESSGRNGSTSASARGTWRALRWSLALPGTSAACRTMNAPCVPASTMRCVSPSSAGV